MNYSRNLPPLSVEYLYYFSVFYAIMGSALGLSAGFVGVGLLAILAAACVFYLGPQANTILSMIVVPIGCGLSFLLLQTIVHGESLMGEYVRAFVPWILTLIITQTLAVRAGFLRRFGFAAALIGLTVLPYLGTYTAGAALERTGLDRSVAIANPNDLAMWFGFCAVYFAVVGIETSRPVIRIAASLSGLVCLYVIGLTVSRGTLFAVALACLIVFRRLLKQGLIPICIVVFLAWGLYASGTFAKAADSYSNRATEESGRFLVWPLALERSLDAWATGVGVANVETYVPQAFRGITPHNGFLFFALVSGVIPVMLFIAYWLRAFRGLANLQRIHASDAAYALPLTLYCFLVTLTANTTFMAPWVTATLASALSGTLPQSVPTRVVRRLRWRMVHRRSQPVT